MLQGRVLDPDGKPVRGAKLFAPRAKTAEPVFAKHVALEQIGITDAEGRFHLTFARPHHERMNYLLAYAAGFGVDWIELDEAGRLPEATLRLVKDVPITGRIINTEGRPVAGVSVSVAAIHVPANDNLDDFLAGWLHNWYDHRNFSKLRKHLYIPLDDINGAATTDEDGRFSLHGGGGERMVHLAIHGGGLAQAVIWIVARPGFDAKPYNAALRKTERDREFLSMSPFLGLYSPSLTFVAQHGKTIEGAIEDADSGKPLSGFPLYISTTWGESIAAVSDAGGKYRFDGLTKNTQGYRGFILPPGDSGYLSQNIHAADSVGFTKVQFDIELVKGAIVAGRVVDKQTGRGVRCGIRFAPLPDNKFFDSKPGFDNYRHDHTMSSTDADGRFRLATIPGKALVMAQVNEDQKFNGEHLCLYRCAVPDAGHKDIFKKEGDTWSVATADGRIEFLGIENAVKVIEVKEKGEIRVELSVDPGTTARIAVQDADGQPLAGVWASGLADRWPIAYKLPEATAPVYALNPDEPRTMAFFHPERKLGGTATVRGDEREPVIVKLAPLGQVFGRLLDENGDPLEDVEVSIHPADEAGSELYRFAAPSGKPVHSDKEGRFRIEDVVPDMKFGLNLRREHTFFTGEPRIGLHRIESGAMLDLGDLRVKPAS